MVLCHRNWTIWSISRLKTILSICMTRDFCFPYARKYTLQRSGFFFDQNNVLVIHSYILIWNEIFRQTTHFMFDSYVCIRLCNVLVVHSYAYYVARQIQYSSSSSTGGHMLQEAGDIGINIFIWPRLASRNNIHSSILIHSKKWCREHDALIINIINEAEFESLAPGLLRNA